MYPSIHQRYFICYGSAAVLREFWGVSDIPSIVEPARELNRPDPAFQDT